MDSYQKVIIYKKCSPPWFSVLPNCLYQAQISGHNTSSYPLSSITTQECTCLILLIIVSTRLIIIYLDHTPKQIVWAIWLPKTTPVNRQSIKSASLNRMPLHYKGRVMHLAKDVAKPMGQRHIGCLTLKRKTVCQMQAIHPPKGESMWRRTLPINTGRVLVERYNTSYSVGLSSMIWEQGLVDSGNLALVWEEFLTSYHTGTLNCLNIIQLSTHERRKSYIFDGQAWIAEMPFCTFFSSTHSIDTPLKKRIKALIGIVFIWFPMPLDKGLHLSEELLDQFRSGE